LLAPFASGPSVITVERPRLRFGAMQRFLAVQQVAKQYWQERLQIVERSPRNAAGKVQKFLLREQTRQLSEG
jgi:cyclohexanecarboxylate-CoA ligase